MVKRTNDHTITKVCYNDFSPGKVTGSGMEGCEGQVLPEHSTKVRDMQWALTGRRKKYNKVLVLTINFTVLSCFVFQHADFTATQLLLNASHEAEPNVPC